MGYEPNALMMLPFAVLLATIAIGPLLFPKWWLKHYPKVAIGLGLITVVYYLFWLPPQARKTVLHSGEEYVSFIALIGSLYIVSGGIHIIVKGEATPFVNALFLLIGAILANFLGTTGASMLLIRPWLRMNKYRVSAHHVVFFIFIVSNIGGCLTPIGDPPLFLGYLKGIPFWWVAEHCWPMWAVGLTFLLLAFLIVDYRNYLRADRAVREQLAEPPDQWRFEGLWNIIFLGVILGAVFLTKPRFLREILMLAAVIGSYFTTRKAVHQANHFNFHPIQEVAILFIGIFATMMPALDWLQLNASKLGHPSAAFFYFSSGTLSSLLDNAPTYLSFLTVITGSFVDAGTIDQVQQLVQNGAADLTHVSEGVRRTFEILQKYHASELAGKAISSEQIGVAYLLGDSRINHFLVALSVAAVFFGACTYIGNGPNFMVKSIAHHQRVQTPTFVGYIGRFTLPFLLPMLVLVWWLFFRH